MFAVEDGLGPRDVRPAESREIDPMIAVNFQSNLLGWGGRGTVAWKGFNPGSDRRPQN